MHRFVTRHSFRAARIAAIALSVTCIGPAIAVAPVEAAPAPPTWKIQTTPDLIAHLNAVSCPSKNYCVAVGNAGAINEASVAAHWNGSSWKVLPVPNGPEGELTGVSCTSPTACTAVGNTSVVTAAEPFAARWNGVTWVAQLTPRLPSSGSLRAVSCPASNACVAVGTTGSATLVERWNGTAWRVQPAPQPEGSVTADLDGVSCPSRNSCVAVGTNRTSLTGDRALAQHWDGAAWSLQPTPVALQDDLNGVSCTSAAACTAVGSRGEDSLVLRWDGTAWTTQSAPKEAGQRYHRMFGVSCTSSSDCMAVGDYNEPAVPTPAAWRWNGSAWSLSTLPVPSGRAGGHMGGVSCTSANACTAVGTSYTDEELSTRRLLVERYS